MRRLTMLLPVLGWLAACSGDDAIFIAPDPDSYVVQAFLFTDEPLQGVTVTGVLPVDADSTEVPPAISDAALTVWRGSQRFDLAPTPGEPGHYHYEGTDLTIKPGDVFDLDIAVNGRAATARTVVPAPPVGLRLAADSLIVSDPFSGGGPGQGRLGGFNSGLVVHWSNPGGELHFVVVDNLEVDPTILPTTEFFSRFATRFISQPTAADSSIVQQLSLTHYGRHRVRLYRVNDEYADLYEGLQQDSRDLNEPPSNIRGALGIFSAFSADSAFFEVR